MLVMSVGLRFFNHSLMEIRQRFVSLLPFPVWIIGLRVGWSRKITVPSCLDKVALYASST